jgi:hypothetical protein
LPKQPINSVKLLRPMRLTRSSERPIGLGDRACLMVLRLQRNADNHEDHAEQNSDNHDALVGLPIGLVK